MNVLHSPVPHLFESNDCPSDVERHAILGAISTAEAELMNLEVQVDNPSINKSPVLLKDQMRLYSHFIQSHYTLLAPIRRPGFPPEILRDIFLFCLDPHNPNGSEEPQPGKWLAFPWAISQVCQHWRAIALSTSSLWTRIPIIKPHHAHTSTPEYIRNFSDFLLRSNTKPLDIFVFILPEDNYAFDRLTASHPIFNVLVRYSHRWQSFNIYGIFDLSWTTAAEALFNTAFKGVKGRLPILRRLKIEFDADEHEDILEHTKIDIFSDAPQLKEVRMDGIFPDVFALPWKQLQHYLEDATSNWAVKRLEVFPLHRGLSPSLQTLTVSRRLPRKPELLQNSWQAAPTPPLGGGGQPTITLESLRSLRLICTGADTFIPNLLSSLTAPILEDIVVHCELPISRTTLLQLGAMCSRSTSSLPSSHITSSYLQRLSLHFDEDSPLERGDLRKLFRLVPQLVFLDTVLSLSSLEGLRDLANVGQNDGKTGQQQICQNSAGSGAIPLQTWSADVLLPCLQTLHLSISSDASREERYKGVLSAIASSRCDISEDDDMSGQNCGGVRKLKTLRLLFTPSISRYRKLREDIPHWQSVLNGWYMPSFFDREEGAEEEEERYLKKWSDSLINEITLGRNGHSEATVERSQQLFEEMNQFISVVQDVKNLYKSRMRKYLRRFYTKLHETTRNHDLDYDINKEDLMWDLSSVIRNICVIYAKWEPMLLDVENIIKMHRWTLGSEDSLLYLPRDRIAHFTRGDLARVIDGKLDDVFEEVSERAHLSRFPST